MFQDAYWHFGEGFRVAVRVKSWREELKRHRLRFEQGCAQSSGGFNGGSKEEDSH